MRGAIRALIARNPIFYSGNHGTNNHTEEMVEGSEKKKRERLKEKKGVLKD